MCLCAKQQHREKKNNKKHKNFRPNIFKRLDLEIVVFLVFLFPAILSCIAGDGHLPQPFMNKFSNKLKTNETIANESFRRGSLIKRELIVFCSIISAVCKADFKRVLRFVGAGILRGNAREFLKVSVSLDYKKLALFHFQHAVSDFEIKFKYDQKSYSAFDAPT